MSPGRRARCCRYAVDSTGGMNARRPVYPGPGAGGHGDPIEAVTDNERTKGEACGALRGNEQPSYPRRCRGQQAGVGGVTVEMHPHLLDDCRCGRERPGPAVSPGPTATTTTGAALSFAFASSLRLV